MKTEQLALFLISPDSTVVEAMQRIDRNARGILFVTNEQQKLLGVVTDGDIFCILFPLFCPKDI